LVPMQILPGRDCWNHFSGGAIQLPALRRRSIQAVSSLSRFSLVGPARFELPFQENLSEGSVLFTE
jgi:hypothetical protein